MSAPSKLLSVLKKKTDDTSEYLKDLHKSGAPIKKINRNQALLKSLKDALKKEWNRLFNS